MTNRVNSKRTGIKILLCCMLLLLLLASAFTYSSIGVLFDGIGEKGRTIITLKIGTEFNIKDIEELAKENAQHNKKMIDVKSEIEGSHEVTIKMEYVEENESNALIEKLKSKYGENVQATSIHYIKNGDPTIKNYIIIILAIIIITSAAISILCILYLRRSKKSISI